MFTLKNFLLSLSVMFFCSWTVPVSGSVIEGPVLDNPECGWADFGLLIRAEVDVNLVSVRFPNQGQADLIQLLRDADSSLLASIPVPAGDTNQVVRIDYPLAAQEVYRLVATTPNNKYFGDPGAFQFPSGNPEITVLSSYLGVPYPDLWFTFNDITTGQTITETGTENTELEAFIDIKPGSAVNSINLKSKGVVPVAIITTEDFDAVNVDAGSVVFAGASPVRWQIDDVDGDGNDDMLLHFKTEELTDLSPGSAEAALTGATLAGIPFSGTDTVNIVPKK